MLGLNIFWFYLQMTIEKMLKPDETCLKRKYQLKYIFITWEENVATNKKYVFEISKPLN